MNQNETPLHQQSPHPGLFAEHQPKRSAGPVTASLVYGWRALLRMKHVPEQLFDVTLFPIMFTLMFTYLFGGALAGSTGEYLQFLLPGILVQSVVFVTVYTGFGLNTDISKGIFDRMRSLPVWQPAPIVGALLGDTVRYTLASVLTVLLGLILGFRPEGGLIGVVLGVVLLLFFSFSLSWIWTMLGLILRTPNSVMGVSMMVLFPLTFVSNIFVDPSTMPVWLQGFVSINPVTMVVTSVRHLMNGLPALREVLITLGMSGALIGIFAPITMYLYHRKQ